MGLVETVRNMLDQRCLVSGRLNKSGCKVSMQGAPRPRLIVDFDKPGSPLKQDQTRCDYLFVAEDDQGPGWVSPLELKRGRLQADDAVKQLQAGATAAEGIVPWNKPFRFRPVAAFRGSSRFEISKLKSKSCRVRFRGRTEAIRLISCGEPLAKVLHT